MDVLVSYGFEEMGQLIAHLLGHDARVGRADLVVGADHVLSAVSGHQYDLHLVGLTSIATCRAVTKRIIDEEIVVYQPTRRVLIGESPSALNVANAIWLGFDGVIDLNKVHGSMCEALLTPAPTPIGHYRLVATGSPIVGICHDKTDIRILTGIVEGLTDPEIAENLHYAVQSIRNRVSRILHDSGAHNRTQLATMFLQPGGVVAH